nr:MAG TPA: hypothetical protein [Caudoviricetes sp.]
MIEANEYVRTNKGVIAELIKKEDFEKYFERSK